MNRNEAEQEAIKMVEDQFGFDPAYIIKLKTESITWIDSCLELPNIEEDCSLNNVPGYLILLYADNNIFEIHSDRDTQNIRVINYLTHHNSIIDVAILYLAKTYQFPKDTISVNNFEPVQWPDSCLGVAKEGSVCAPVVTPGYLIELYAADNIYEFHTDFYGSRLIPVE